ncbi:YgjP-like metallopeptidase domain-containing protein [Hymenobacter radiodurans]|uniref:YgjP-like metallopeptidase domain-containing protein n=1 Tax=Hymenobacter radiodurans TaxID=2496028 RepID=UPI00196ADEEA|nr:YgjP-like metallopeptidase domain-containing protein [Hymenobacter radiodurans]
MAHIHIDGLQIEVVRKNIRTLRLTVYAPDGKVRVAAPLRMAASTIEEFVIARRVWILKHQAKFAARERPVALAYVSGEAHFFQGKAYQLQVLEAKGGHAWPFGMSSFWSYPYHKTLLRSSAKAC